MGLHGWLSSVRLLSNPHGRMQDCRIANPARGTFTMPNGFLLLQICIMQSCCSSGLNS